jgi:hypothetical protein
MKEGQAMNLNGTQQDMFHRTLAFVQDNLPAVIASLVFWALMGALLTCPVWLPALIESAH